MTFRPKSFFLAHHQIRHNIQTQTLLQTCKATDGTGNTWVHQTIAGNPTHFFIIAPRNPAQIDAPICVRRIEGNGLKRNAQFSSPTQLIDIGFGLPDAGPVAINLRHILKNAFDAHAIGIDLEKITAAPI